MSFHLGFRRMALGLAAGLLASFPLVLTLGHAALAIVLAGLCGFVYAFVSPSTGKRSAGVDSVFTAAVLGIPLWRAISVFALPTLAGRGALCSTA